MNNDNGEDELGEKVAADAGAVFITPMYHSIFQHDYRSCGYILNVHPSYALLFGFYICVLRPTDSDSPPHWIRLGHDLLG